MMFSKTGTITIGGFTGGCYSSRKEQYVVSEQSMTKLHKAVNKATKRFSVHDINDNNPAGLINGRIITIEWDEEIIETKRV